MRTHELKTWPSHYAGIIDGTKKFEARKNDRDFAVGDILHLREFDPSKPAAIEDFKYTGRSVHVRVTSILHGGQFAIERGHCVMSIEKAENAVTEMTDALGAGLRRAAQVGAGEVLGGRYPQNSVMGAMASAGLMRKQSEAALEQAQLQQQAAQTPVHGSVIRRPDGCGVIFFPGTNYETSVERWQAREIDAALQKIICDWPVVL